MDLSGILGAITQTAQTYYDVRNMRNMPIMTGATPGFNPNAPYNGRVRPLTRNVAGGLVPGIGQGLLNYGVAEAAGDLWDLGVETWDEWMGNTPQQQLLPGPPQNGGGQMACGETNPANIVYKWDCATQQYTPRKKYRRRRKRLASKSDIKDLASLKGIVGQGKVMETWIATHC